MLLAASNGLQREQQEDRLEQHGQERVLHAMEDDTYGDKGGSIESWTLFQPSGVKTPQAPNPMPAPGSPTCLGPSHTPLSQRRHSWRARQAAADQLLAEPRTSLGSDTQPCRMHSPDCARGRLNHPTGRPWSGPLPRNIRAAPRGERRHSLCVFPSSSSGALVYLGAAMLTDAASASASPLGSPRAQRDVPGGAFSAAPPSDQLQPPAPGRTWSEYWAAWQPSRTTSSAVPWVVGGALAAAATAAICMSHGSSRSTAGHGSSHLYLSAIKPWAAAAIAVPAMAATAMMVAAPRTSILSEAEATEGSTAPRTMLGSAAAMASRLNPFRSAPSLARSQPGTAAPGEPGNTAPSAGAPAEAPPGEEWAASEPAEPDPGPGPGPEPGPATWGAASQTSAAEGPAAFDARLAAEQRGAAYAPSLELEEPLSPTCSAEPGALVAAATAAACTPRPGALRAPLATAPSAPVLEAVCEEEGEGEEEDEVSEPEHISTPHSDTSSGFATLAVAAGPAAASTAAALAADTAVNDHTAPGMLIAVARMAPAQAPAGEAEAQDDAALVDAAGAAGTGCDVDAAPCTPLAGMWEHRHGAVSEPCPAVRSDTAYEHDLGAALAAQPLLLSKPTGMASPGGTGTASDALSSSDGSDGPSGSAFGGPVQLGERASGEERPVAFTAARCDTAYDHTLDRCGSASAPAMPEGGLPHEVPAASEEAAAPAVKGQPADATAAAAAAPALEALCPAGSGGLGSGAAACTPQPDDLRAPLAAAPPAHGLEAVCAGEGEAEAKGEGEKEETPVLAEELLLAFPLGAGAIAGALAAAAPSAETEPGTRLAQDAPHAGAAPVPAEPADGTAHGVAQGAGAMDWSFPMAAGAIAGVAVACCAAGSDADAIAEYPATPLAAFAESRGNAAAIVADAQPVVAAAASAAADGDGVSAAVLPPCMDLAASDAPAAASTASDAPQQPQLDTTELDLLDAAALPSEERDAPSPLLAAAWCAVNLPGPAALVAVPHEGGSEGSEVQLPDQQAAPVQEDRPAVPELVPVAPEPEAAGEASDSMSEVVVLEVAIEGEAAADDEAVLRPRVRGIIAAEDETEQAAWQARGDDGGKGGDAPAATAGYHVESEPPAVAAGAAAALAAAAAPLLVLGPACASPAPPAPLPVQLQRVAAAPESSSTAAGEDALHALLVRPLLFGAPAPAPEAAADKAPGLTADACEDADDGPQYRNYAAVRTLPPSDDPSTPAPTVEEVAVLAAQLSSQPSCARISLDEQHEPGTPQVADTAPAAPLPASNGPAMAMAAAAVAVPLELAQSRPASSSSVMSFPIALDDDDNDDDVEVLEDGEEEDVLAVGEVHSGRPAAEDAAVSQDEQLAVVTAAAAAAAVAAAASAAAVVEDEASVGTEEEPEPVSFGRFMTASAPVPPLEDSPLPEAEAVADTAPEPAPLLLLPDEAAICPEPEPESIAEAAAAGSEPADPVVAAAAASVESAEHALAAAEALVVQAQLAAETAKSAVQEAESAVATLPQPEAEAAAPSALEAGSSAVGSVEGEEAPAVEMAAAAAAAPLLLRSVPVQEQRGAGLQAATAEPTTASVALPHAAAAAATSADEREEEDEPQYRHFPVVRGAPAAMHSGASTLKPSAADGSALQRGLQLTRGMVVPELPPATSVAPPVPASAAAAPVPPPASASVGPVSAADSFHTAEQDFPEDYSVSREAARSTHHATDEPPPPMLAAAAFGSCYSHGAAAAAASGKAAAGGSVRSPGSCEIRPMSSGSSFKSASSRPEAAPMAMGAGAAGKAASQSPLSAVPTPRRPEAQNPTPKRPEVAPRAAAPAAAAAAAAGSGAAVARAAGSAVAVRALVGAEPAMSASVQSQAGSLVMPDGAKDTTLADRLPLAHYFAFKGDLKGTLKCITGGHNLSECVSLRNGMGRLVCGITPLFLAAQRGHLEVCKLLVENGANPMRPCYIQGTSELCTPAEVASLNLHFAVSRYIKSAAKAKRKAQEVLASAENSRHNSASNRPASSAGRAAAAAADARALAATKTYVESIDIAAFDPAAGEQPPAKKGLRGFFTKFNCLTPCVGPMPAAPAAPLPRADAAPEAAAEPANEQDKQEALGRFVRDMDFANWRPADQ